MPSGVYKRTSKIIQNVRLNALGSIRSKEFKDNLRRIRSGENCNFWKGGISPLNKKIRKLAEYVLWRTEVFKRDKYQCQNCGRIHCELHPHHIKSFSSIIKEFNIKTTFEAIMCGELWDINNGVTLCVECHKLTDNYGNKKHGK